MNLYVRRRARLAGVLVLALATLLLPLSPQASAATTTVTFNYIGASQEWIVPEGVTEITIEAWGAQGDCWPSWPVGPGGRGGYAKRQLSVHPSEALQVTVGGQRGFNGGGEGFSRGGGASDLRRGGSGLSHRVLVAGGGGGCGWFSSGGDGGGVVGLPSYPKIYSGVFTPAGGGTPAAGGSGQIGAPYTGDGAWGSNAGASGSSGQGGSSSFYRGDYQGGGGGGGYYGGGGGAGQGGGGGGSGYAPDGELKTGVREGDGLIVITYSTDGPCFDSTTRVDRIFGAQNGYEYEADIHNTPTDVAVCTTLTSPGGATILYRELVVAKDTDPTDYLPPYDPPEVDGDAPPGDEAGSPCPVTHANHGTENARGYVRQSDASSDDTVICVGFRLPGAQRHVRVTLHEAPTI